MPNQYIIDLNQNGVREKIINILRKEKVSYNELELQDKKTVKSRLFKSDEVVTVKVDNQQYWCSISWLDYLISKGFWIDSYTSNEVVTTAGRFKTNIVIFHKKS